jgi:chromate reductase
MQHRLRDLGHEADIVDFQQYDIPLVAQGHIDEAAFTPFQQHLANSMRKAQLVIIITPEYNWSTTPEILNFLHRFGDRVFADLFADKVFSTIGVSTGKGGKIPALHIGSILNKIISFMDLTSVVSAKIFESHFTKEVLDEEGKSLGNMQFEAGLDNYIRYTLHIAAKWNSTAAGLTTS